MSVFGDAFSVGAVQVVLQGFKGGLAKQGEANHTSFQVWYPNSKSIILICLQCCGSEIFIPDPGSGFFHPRSQIRIFHSGSGFFHPRSRSLKATGSLIGNTDLKNNLSKFKPQFVSKLSEIWSGMSISDINSRIRIFSHPELQIRIRIQASKKHWIPDPQHG